MKKFNNFEDAFDWGAEVIKKGCLKAEEFLAEEIYKDSNEFTYRESGDMYKSGEENSASFKEGLIIEKAPYVRRRYYEGGKAGAGNPKAQPRWFEKTVAKNNNTYKKQAKKIIDKQIGQLT